MSEGYLIYIGGIILFIIAVIFWYIRRHKNIESFKEKTLSGPTIHPDKLKEMLNKKEQVKWTPEQLRRTKLYKTIYNKWFKLHRSEDYDDSDLDNPYNTNTKEYEICKLAFNESYEDAMQLQNDINESIDSLRESISWFYEGVNSMEHDIYKIYEKLKVPNNKRIYTDGNAFSNSIEKIIKVLKSL